MDHIKKYHAPAQQYVCSGTKQLKIIMALHDSDQLEGRLAGQGLCGVRQGLRERRETCWLYVIWDVPCKL